MNSNNENERPEASLWQLSVIQAGWLAGWLAGRQDGNPQSAPSVLLRHVVPFKLNCLNA